LTLDPSIVIAAFGALVAGLSGAARLIYVDLRRDRDYWRGVALQLMAVNNKAIDVAAVKQDA
jgi:hypothetical protein